MLQMIRILLPLLLILGMSACHSTTVVHKLNGTPYSLTSESPAPDQKFKQGSMVFGIYPVSHTPDVVCPNSIPEVKLVTKFTDLLIHFFIGPFYTTKTVEIYCKK
ncbi:hypothetical protein EHQ53_09200 [Leptospira langatensis]|uniref:Lipoprotein n=1 Tax=Leptospira langatensis TaxID=2484983 RepID=A0A5F1ZV89_9LEPT|nr:hypothetical protein [Leptospira langatensis]TGK01206.1 hypothetical protein EHO57_09675 [Leptospira langatensis]TGL42344.1 hypothetical protein EHQ53_09200 [Leptospira langatensis]